MTTRTRACRTLFATALLALLAASGCATGRGHWYTGVEGGPSRE